MIPSASDWTPGHTILLISFPGWRSGSRVCLKSRTQIDVEPDVSEAEWLRKWAQREGGKSKANEVWPENGKAGFPNL